MMHPTRWRRSSPRGQRELKARRDVASGSSVCPPFGARRPRPAGPTGSRPGRTPPTMRGLIRTEIVPLSAASPAAEENIRRLADERPRLPRGMEETLLQLLADRAGSNPRDLGKGIKAVREYDCVLAGSRACPLGRLGDRGRRARFVVRARRPGDRLEGRSKKLQDVFVDAKVPRGRAGRLAGGRDRRRGRRCPGSWRRHGCGWRARDEDWSWTGRSGSLIDAVASARASPSSARRFRRTNRGQLPADRRPKGAVFFMADLEPGFRCASWRSPVTARRPIPRGSCAFSQGPRHQHRGPQRPRGRWTSSTRGAGRLLVPDAEPGVTRGGLA